MKKWMLFLLMFSGSFVYSQTVTTESLLKEMTDFNAVTYWPVPYYSAAQASSYDRHSIAPDKPGWFANADYSQFIRSDGNEHVMLDEDGPGALVRFWMTTFKRAGTLRIYFDNNTKAEIVIPAYDLMKLDFNPGLALLTPHSSYEPVEKGGSTLYLPMPYAKHCKVTWEDAAPEIKEPRYYQINFRTYEHNTAVKTFTLVEAAHLKPLMEKVSEQLLHPVNVTEGQQASINKLVLPQGTVAVNLPHGPNAIRLLTIEGNSNIILKIQFDGEQTVYCPVADFAGSGGKPLQSWYRTVSADGKIISRWTMPYKKSAIISLINLSNDTMHVLLNAVTENYAWTRNSMYFHADRKSDAKVMIKKWDEPGAIEWQFCNIRGKGIFMGDCLSVYNYMHSWYGEGDQKLYVDGGRFPVEYGTGTEDYYNTSWAPVVLYQTPFANAPRADAADSYGNNTFTRTRNLDGVVFKNAFRYELEMLGWANGEADCAATIYWYGFKQK
jgi:hypothetical protein